VDLHVDDFLSTVDDELLQDFRKKLYKRFTMTGGLTAEHYGLDIAQNVDGSRSIAATHYIHSMVKKLGLTDLPHVLSPMNPDDKLEYRIGTTDDAALRTACASVVGMIGFPANTCRPDVACTHKMLAQHMNHPTEQHLRAAHRAVAYLQSTADCALTYTYGATGDCAFFGSADAAHNNVAHKGKGTTGNAFQWCGGAICWRSKTQTITALPSAAEAEVIARELQFLGKLLAEFLIGIRYPAPIAQDNEASLAICASEYYTQHARTTCHCGFTTCMICW
jgi:hypothetical protein